MLLWGQGRSHDYFTLNLKGKGLLNTWIGEGIGDSRSIKSKLSVVNDLVNREIPGWPEYVQLYLKYEKCIFQNFLETNPEISEPAITGITCK